MSLPNIDIEPINAVLIALDPFDIVPIDILESLHPSSAYRYSSQSMQCSSH